MVLIDVFMIWVLMEKDCFKGLFISLTGPFLSMELAGEQEKDKEDGE